MSTQIAEITGRKEFDPHKGEKTIYVDSTLHITRFWGRKTEWTNASAYY